MTPQEIEQYVLLASSASNLQHQQQANTLLNQWVSSSDPDTLAATLIKVLQSTRREVVHFYALTAFLNIIRQTKPEHRAALRQEIFSQLLLNEPSSCWNPTFLRTKAGVLLARLVRLDFPQHWPNAFGELQSTELLQRAPDIYFRTLTALMDDFGKDETEVNTRLKDWLRGYSFAGDNNNHNNNNNNNSLQNPAVSPKQSISGQLLQTTVVLLVQGLANNDENICLLALTALKGFMSWMDLSLVLEDQVLHCVFTSLARGSTTDSPTADAGVIAVECLQELVARGMEEDKKLSILVHTGVFEKIHAHVNLETVDASPIDVVLEVARFINLIGLEIVDFNQDTKIMQSQLLDLFFRCFAYDDIDISGAVIPLAGSLVSQEQDVVLISQLVTVTYRQMRYPEDFQFDYEDEDEAEEEMYRAELRKLHQKLIRAAPEACLQFTCQTMLQLPSPLSTAPTPDIEAALRLVYHYCEGIRPGPGMKVVMKNETFRNLLIAIHTSDVCFHPHREVLTLYYEMTVRYYPLLKDRPDLLQKTLGSLTGTQGLQHGHPRVRSRSCYFLLRLVKSVGSSNGKNSVLRPYVETAVSGIQSLIESNSVQLRTEDVLNMFETIGLLVGKTGLEPEEQQRYLTQVITPHVRSIERILEQKQAISLDAETYGELLSSSIAAIAFLSKGFRQPADEVKIVLLETMKINIAVLEAMPDHSQVRNKCFVLLQRSIQLLEDKVLPSMPQMLYLLVGHCDSNDILDVAQLFNQLCIKFQAEAIPAMDAALLPFLRKCYALVSSITAAPSEPTTNATAVVAPHLRTEQLSVQKLTFVVLQHMVSHKATAILLSPTNASSLESILQSMGEGATHVEEALMKKTCLVFFKELIDQWCVVDESSASGNHHATPHNGNNGGATYIPPPSYVVQGYIRFLLDVLIPGVIESFCRDSFQVEDANHWRSLSEFASILEILQQRLPSDVYQQQVLLNTLTNRLGCPAPIVEGFRGSSRKDMEASLKNLIQESKKRKAQ
jgi:exportin-T